jgi:hypothetical protein
MGVAFETARIAPRLTGGDILTEATIRYGVGLHLRRPKSLPSPRRASQRRRRGGDGAFLAISDTRNLAGPGLLYRCEGACLLPPQTAPRSIETTPACSNGTQAGVIRLASTSPKPPRNFAIASLRVAAVLFGRPGVAGTIAVTDQNQRMSGGVPADASS